MQDESKLAGFNLRRSFTRDAATKLLSDLIAIDSVNPSLVPGGAGEREIAEHVGGVLAAAGFAVKVEEISPMRCNVVGVLRGTGGGKSLMLVGHLDTVSKDGMAIPPLEPRVDGDRIYGRGAADMKGGLASILLAVQALSAEGTRLAGDLIVAGVADEEYASIGVEALVRRWTADAALITEPTGGSMVVAHKGFAWINLEVKGKAAHGSLFDGGVDAITNAGHFLVAYDRYHRDVLARVQPRLLSRPSVHASLVSGGRELSTYPDSCTVSFERRTVPGETRQSIQAELDSILAGLRRDVPGFEATAEIFFWRDPYEIGLDEPVVQALMHAAGAVFRGPPEIGGSSGWMDSAVLGAAGIPTVILGPSGEGGHAPVEWVNLPSVIAVADIIARLAQDFCGGRTVDTEG